MNLRRALAAAAATAVIAPAALMAAPAAYANDGGTTSQGSTSEGSTGEPTTGETTPDAATPDEATTGEATAGETTEPGTVDPDPDADADADVDNPDADAEAKEDDADAATDEDSDVDTTTGGNKGEDEEPAPLECNDGSELVVDDNLVTSLNGLPSKIVAGSGFHNFTLNVSNKSDASYKRVDLGVFAAQVDEKSWNISTSHLELQYKDPDSKMWETISLDENDVGAGYVGYRDVLPNESFSLELRLSVDASAPAGLGFAIGIGLYANDQGDCVYAAGESYYEFDILRTGAKPGEVPGAKPQGGKKPLPAKPAGNTEINPKGNLAATGSSDVLPMFALAGGTAVALGVGAVFVVRRRKAGDTGAAA